MLIRHRPHWGRGSWSACLSDTGVAFAQPETLHATCVAYDGRGVLITGAAGSGKSSLALMLMGLGCALVADDRVRVMMRDRALIASAPDTLQGLIEARGIGILNAATVPEATLALAVDLDRAETERLPERRVITLLECPLPLILRIEGPQFAAAILQVLRSGWSAR